MPQSRHILGGTVPAPGTPPTPPAPGPISLGLLPIMAAGCMPPGLTQVWPLIQSYCLFTIKDCCKMMGLKKNVCVSSKLFKSCFNSVLESLYAYNGALDSGLVSL